jgi:mRNA-degrading endonuclease RelE of RelBE toxin-antitoxin system
MGKMMRDHEVRRLKEFDRDLTKLSRRYRTLKEDLDVFLRAQVGAFHLLGIDNRGIFQIDDLGPLVAPVFKAKKFACRALRGRGARSGIRVIYAYFEAEKRFELVEIYSKSDKDVEDRDRIRKYYSAKKSG